MFTSLSSMLCVTLSFAAVWQAASWDATLRLMMPFTLSSISQRLHSCGLSFSTVTLPLCASSSSPLLCLHNNENKLLTFSLALPCLICVVYQQKRPKRHLFPDTASPWLCKNGYVALAIATVYQNISNSDAPAEVAIVMSFSFLHDWYTKKK